MSDIKPSHQSKSVTCECFFIDPQLNVALTFPPATTIESAVGKLESKTLKKASMLFDIQFQDQMGISIVPYADSKAQLHSLGDEPLTVLLRPTPKDKSQIIGKRVSNRKDVQALEKKNAELEVQLWVAQEEVKEKKNEQKKSVTDDGEKTIEARLRDMESKFEIRFQTQEGINMSLRHELASQQAVNTSLRHELASQEIRFQTQEGVNTSLRHELASQEIRFQTQEGVNTSLRHELEEVNTSLRRELASHKENLDELNRVVKIITPLHVRVLMDLARSKIVRLCSCDDWESLCGEKTAIETQEYVRSSLANLQTPLSAEATKLLCGVIHTNVRRAGNAAAHNAKKEDVRSAVERTPDCRDILEEVFQFAYEEKL